MNLSARDVAVKALRQDSAGGAAVTQLAAAAGLSRADTAFARELTLGCLRRRQSLRAVIKAMLSQPGRKHPSAVDAILHVAVYQLLFLDRVPDFAAVNEAVEQANRCNCPKQRGLINAVLRNLLRQLGPVEQGPVPASPDVIPVGPDAFRRSTRPLLPDPTTDAAAYLDAACNLPEALGRRWLAQTGSLAATCALAAHANTSPPLIARVNTLRMTLQQALASLAADGAQAVAHENGLSVVIQRGPGLAELSAFRAGALQPQDPTATAVGIAAAPAAGMKVLDLCAAPGTKTTHLAEIMGNRGKITAVDLPGKLHRITENCDRMGISIVRTVGVSDAGSLPLESYNLVLADVPCTNTGVLARRPQARWRFDDETLARAVEDQKFLLGLAAGFVRRNGRLVYSTCSIEPEENDQLIVRFLRKFPRFTLVHKQQTLPGGADDAARWHDGGFTAILQAK